MTALVRATWLSAATAGPRQYRRVGSRFWQGEGFSPPYEISYRGMKPPKVSAALGCFYLRRRTDLPQVGSVATIGSA
jgi:hypothetical protein